MYNVSIHNDGEVVIGDVENSWKYMYIVILSTLWTLQAILVKQKEKRLHAIELWYSIKMVYNWVSV